MLSETHIHKLKEKHTIDKFDISVNELSKHGEIYQIDLLYSYDIDKQKKQSLVHKKKVIKEEEPETIKNIKKFEWKNWTKIEYSDDFVETRSARDGCMQFC